LIGPQPAIHTFRLHETKKGTKKRQHVLAVFGCL